MPTVNITCWWRIPSFTASDILYLHTFFQSCMACRWVADGVDGLWLWKYLIMCCIRYTKSAKSGGLPPWKFNGPFKFLTEGMCDLRKQNVQLRISRYVFILILISTHPFKQRWHATRLCNFWHYKVWVFTHGNTQKSFVGGAYPEHL
jgi:hypothetical protein